MGLPVRLATISGLALGLLAGAPAPVASQVPAPEVVCVRTVGDAALDDTLPLAGRSRSLADDGGRVVARQLTCPYARDQRLVLEMTVTWQVARSSSSPVGPVGCRDDGYVVGDDGTAASMAAPGRQAAVQATGDPDLVAEAEQAAAVYLDVIGEGALACGAGDGGAGAPAEGGGPPWALLLALAALALLGAGAWATARRRARSWPEERQVPVRGADEGDMGPDEALSRLRGWIALDRLELVADEGRRLVVRLDARPPIDVAVEVGEGGAEPIRLRARLVPEGATALDRVELESLVEEAVVRRSALVDARLGGQGTVEVVVVIYPDGLSRHALHSALFECQKLRDCLALDVRRASPALHEG